MRPNASVTVDICTIVVVFCVYQDEFLNLSGRDTELTLNVLLKCLDVRYVCVYL